MTGPLAGPAPSSIDVEGRRDSLDDGGTGERQPALSGTS